MHTGGFCRAWCDEQRCLPQGLQHRCGIEATDAVILEDSRDRLLRHLYGGGGCRHLLPKREEPIVGDVVGQLYGLRIVPPQLLADPIGQTRALLLQLVGHTRPLAQLDHYRIIDR
jgi:hypothetical protein